MKKLLLIALSAVGLQASAQNVLFEDSFETYNDFIITGIGNWSTLDLDLRPTYTGGADNPTWANAGAVMAYQIFNPTTALVTNATSGAEVRNFDPRTGSKYAASWAAVPGAGNVANNDWLISPPITLGSSGNELSVWVKSMSSTYGLEDYSIGVYVGSGTPTSGDDFILFLDALGAEAPYPNWEEVVLSLDDYSGQTIRVGIRNEGLDQYMFMVDDFKVTTADLGVNEAFARKFNTYPNPASNVVTVSNNYNILLTDVTVTDINGRVVKSMKVNNLAEVQVNVAELNAGVYFMNIDTDSGKVVKKFIKS
ncbi:T9SS-dependent choice-of-anchor J family protein [Flavobacterium sedimenticola]|uniref:T9SS type A sorting domain-containing protein n=1 Tax=Flavobacterium sedimenticola TaxID=3043286 RepID=A0ABT6XSC4_9FLAO|nr:T9SS type A sorting domain-containing protein [Flavobacterium sedimenticola]MDI9257732.1 T9SS type A sorting domain-containing protein [Flavobacterium sedimenticola]